MSLQQTAAVHTWFGHTVDVAFECLCLRVHRFGADAHVVSGTVNPAAAGVDAAGAAHRESEHTPDLHSAAVAHASPFAVHPDAVHESTEPVAPVNISVVVAEPVSQQRVLLMLLSLNIRLKVVTFETSQQEISWSKEDSLNILLMRVTDEVSHAEIS